MRPTSGIPAPTAAATPAPNDTAGPSMLVPCFSFMLVLEATTISVAFSITVRDWLLIRSSLKTAESLPSFCRLAVPFPFVPVLPAVRMPFAVSLVLLLIFLVRDSA